jgi:hypothetical protein
MVAGTKRKNDLRRTLTTLGIRWPTGNPDYGFDDRVYVLDSHKIVRLVNKLDAPGQYVTSEGQVYTEKRGARGIVQQLTSPTDKVYPACEPANVTITEEIVDQVAKVISARRAPPTTLHISYDDLVKLAAERSSLAERGDIWGLAVRLIAKGGRIKVTGPAPEGR